MRAFLLFLLGFSFAACTEDAPVPKPVGYFRIDLPDTAYHAKLPECPFAFESSQYSRLEMHADSAHPCWFNIYYPRLKARIYFTYQPVESDLRTHLEDARKLAYEHQIKASGIATTPVTRDSADVYGLQYFLAGDVASPYQFYLTDSSAHFLRASLYFEASPNADSTAPVLDFLVRDMEHFINSLHWND